MRRLDVSLIDLFPPLASGREQYTETRTPGLHVSDVVYSLVSALEPTRYPPRAISRAQTSRPLNGLMLAGLALEDQLGDRLADRYSRLHAPFAFRPGEVTRDGLIGTPDLIDPDVPDVPGDCVLEEWKVTTTSSRDADPSGPKFRYWYWQGKSYCAMTGIHTLRIRALHLVGDYLFDRSPEPGPHFRSWEETFTDRELEEHWRMVTQQAARLRAA